MMRRFFIMLLIFWCFLNAYAQPDYPVYAHPIFSPNTHTHTIANVTGLQGALNGKFDVPAGLITQYVNGTGGLSNFPSPMTFGDSPTIDMTQTGSTITAEVVDGSITPVKLSQAYLTVESQTISEVGDVITLSGGGGSVTDSDNQAISIASGVVSLTNGGSFLLPDASATNELQAISKAGSTITLSNGGGSVTDSDIQDLTLAGTTLSLTGDPTSVNFTGWDTNASNDFPGDYPSLTNIPSTFPPSAHTHPTTDITGLTAAIDTRVGQLSIDAHSDVTAPTPSPGQVLKWNGTAWVPDTDNTTAGSMVFLNLASNYSSTIVTEAAVTGWTFAVTAGKTYRVEVIAAYQTAATTTGGEIGVFLSGGATGTIRGFAEGSVAQTNVATSLRTPMRAIGAADLAGSNLITSGVGTASSDHEMHLLVTFTCTVSGTFNVGWASEVAGSAATLMANSTLTYQALN